ncbi:MAG: CD1247 N-terminal domain-containing protein [Bacillota bacterium]
MADLRARVAYIRGLLSGFDGNGDSKEAYLLKEMVQVLDELSEELAAVREVQEDLEEYVQALDEDLYVLETAIFEDEETELEAGGMPAETVQVAEGADGEASPAANTGEQRGEDF